MYFPVTVPYKTTPVMSKNTGTIYETVEDLSHIIEKSHELNRWGTDLYACRRPDLVQKASSVLGLLNTNDYYKKEPISDIVQFALNFKEDVAIMHKGVLEAICFCYPSSWIPSERVGLSLAEIHGPVADGDQLRKMSQRIAEVMATQDSMRRYVWTISTTGALSNHPNLTKPTVTDKTEIKDLYFRMETQTTMPLGDNETSLFFVKVDTCPLSVFWQNAEYKKTIIDSVNSMTDSILEYKNLAQIKELLNKSS